jgi:NAD(P)-dependent dehydrogenase (short-subunit alcohol dehydrogenase family)
MNGRVIVVTGGGNGIGRAVCVAAAAGGAQVAILDNDGGAAAATAQAITETGGRAWASGCDVSDQSAVNAAFAAIDDELGPPHVLVNNAGINLRTAPLDLELATWERTIAVNLTGYFLCAREAGRRMIARGSGAIVNTSSIAGSSALGRGNFAYSVTKGGVNALTRELAVEWAPHGVRVNAVAPAQVATAGFTADLSTRTGAGDPAASDHARGIPVGRLVEPEEVAAAILFLASDAASMITGVVLPVDGGNLALDAGGTIGSAYRRNNGTS